MTGIVLPYNICADETSGSDNAETLAQIDVLIDGRNYTKALEALSVYIQEHPEQFDKAQRRVSRIMKERTSFNNQAAELADKMRQSSENAEGERGSNDDLDSQKMDIILSLEKSEVNPAREAVDLTNDARRTVRLSYYINRLNFIVAQGSALLNAGTNENQESYVAAFKKFQEGLALKTSESDVYFDGQREIAVVYPESLRKDVETSLSQIREFSRNIESLFDKCQEAYTAYVAAVESLNIDRASLEFGNFISAFSALSETRNLLEKEGENLKELDAQAIEFCPGLGKTSYITFSRCAVLGIDGGSGMTDAIDAFFASRIKDVQREIYAASIKEYARIRVILEIDNGRLFTDADFPSSFLLCRDTAEFLEQGNEINSLYYDGIYGFDEADIEKAVSSGGFAYGFSKSNFTAALALAENIAEESLKFGNLIAKTSPGEEYEESVLSSASRYVNLLENIAVERKSLPEDSLYAWATTEPFSYEKPAGLYNEILDLSENECKKKCGLAWTALAQLYSGKAEMALKELYDRASEAKRLAGGVTGGDALKFYPSKALEESLALRREIEKHEAVISGYKETLDGGALYSASETDYVSGIQKIERAIAELGVLAEETEKTALQSRISINEARKAENEASSSYARALEYLDEGRFDDAREYLSDADEKYKKSLRYEENDELRRKFSAQIAETDAKITSLQNEWVVSTVRSLVDSAYNSYYAGDFSAAKRSLEDAARTWEKTQSEDNTEISQLLGLVNDALESTGGTEISFSDPLYKEMGAYLSNANLLYGRGKELYDAGQTDKGKKILENARNEARKVQRAYPRNSEAFNINLLVNKIISPDLYTISIAQRIAQAETIAGSGKEADMKIALSSLRKLQKVVPDSKEVEDAAGKIEAQIEALARSEQVKRDLARSDSLARQAQNEKNIKRAIELLDEALSLNRFNSFAKNLKDQLYINNAAHTTLKNYLDDADEIIYAQAERLYNDGQKEQAQMLVNRLYEKNPDVAKVIRLRRRIENM